MLNRSQVYLAMFIFRTLTTHKTWSCSCKCTHTLREETNVTQMPWEFLCKSCVIEGNGIKDCCPLNIIAPPVTWMGRGAMLVLSDLSSVLLAVWHGGYYREGGPEGGFMVKLVYLAPFRIFYRWSIIINFRLSTSFWFSPHPGSNDLSLSWLPSTQISR